MSNNCDSCQHNCPRLYIFSDDNNRKIFLCSECRDIEKERLESLGFKLRGDLLQKGGKNA